ncbi:uncharacterized protein F5891DRAFT_1183341 [Suillus fuscotomentosus]|uniref:Uncharacterized protein n=1 Tax=Suillus fuscotomentosus TaxID=1912939 RepID=A0AAD4HR07_9AGAM|nr:uncharacterized protein F5891DRAFT_1183341 [Suillus fuscotomentosus]KAG1905396.1 hypothetical protein F5891DRAFT_1183341 [Suillus fuscotomentosus]
MNQWETNLDLSLGDIGDKYYVNDDSVVHSDSIVQTPAKHYPSSDAPLRKWMGYESRSGYRKEYLLEDLCLEGRGSATNELCSCGESDANGLKE